MSVVILTKDRPELVIRAVRSALAQTLEVIEVIVVVDGPSEPTMQALRPIHDSRLRIIPLPPNVGAAGARNVGVTEARGRWVAFLDDDDEWLPQKLEIQKEAAQKSRHRYPIISCRLIARSEEGDIVRPLRYPSPGEPISEYLFCQRGLFGGEGAVPPSTVFTAKELLERVPFKVGLQRVEDADWLIRACALEGTSVEFVPGSKPLVIFHAEENRPRKSQSADWRYLLSWIDANKQLVTPRAYISFLMTSVSKTAARGKEWKVFWLLLREAYPHGGPGQLIL